MQSTPREKLEQFANVLQGVLFDRLEPELGRLSEKGRLLVAVVGMLPLARWVGPSRAGRTAAKDRQALAAALLAKARFMG